MQELRSGSGTDERPPAAGPVACLIDHDLELAERGQAPQHVRIVTREQVLEGVVVRGEVPAVPIHERQPVFRRPIEGEEVPYRTSGNLQPRGGGGV